MPCPSSLPTIDAHWQYIDVIDTFDTYDQGITRATDMVHTVDSCPSCHFWKDGLQNCHLYKSNHINKAQIVAKEN